MEINLKELLDTNSSKNLFNNLFDISNISIEVYDNNFNNVYFIGLKDICFNIINSKNKSEQSCLNCLKYFEIELTNNEYSFYKCHDSFNKIAKLIHVNNQQIGYLVFSYFFFENEKTSNEQFQNLIQKFDLNEKEFSNLINEIPIYSKDKIYDTINFYHSLIEKELQKNYECIQAFSNKNIIYNKNINKINTYEFKKGKEISFFENVYINKDEENKNFNEIFNVDIIQNIQDSFAVITETASIITKPDGTPITKPSNKGSITNLIEKYYNNNYKNFILSDSERNKYTYNKPIVNFTEELGLMEAIICITIENTHIANWIIGQARIADINEKKIKEFAKKSNTPFEELLNAISNTPIISKEKFKKISEALFYLTCELSEKALQNLKQQKLIFDKKIANEALKINEDKYKAIFENANDGIIFLKNSTFLDCNKKTLELYGCLKHELINKTPIDFSPEKQPDGVNSKIKVEKYISKALKGIPQVFEWQHIRKDGSILEAEVSLNNVIINDETFIQAIVRDISQRKEQEKNLYQKTYAYEVANEELQSYNEEISSANEEIRAVNEQLKELNDKLLNSNNNLNDSKQLLLKAEKVAKIGHWEYYLNNNKINLSEGLQEITGIHSKTIEFKEFTSIIEDKYIENFQNALNYLINFNFKFDIEFRIRTKDETSVYVHSVAEYDNKKNIIFGILQDISESKKTENTLLDVIEKNPVSLQIIDSNGYTLKVNASHTKLFGAVPPPDYCIFEDPLLKSQGYGDYLIKAKKGEVVYFPDFYYNAHELYPEFADTPCWIKMIIFPIIGIDGKPERYVLMHEDFTSRRAYQIQLEENKTHLNNILDSINEIAWSQSLPDNKLLFMSNSSTTIFGRPAQDFIDDNNLWKKIIHPDDVEYVLNQIKDFETKEYLEFEYRIIKPNGDITWVKDKTKVIYSNKKPVRLDGIVVDITEHKKNEKIIQDNKSFIETILNAIPTPVFYKDENLRYIGANKAFEEFYGKTVDEIYGKTVFDISPRELAELYNQKDLDLLKNPDEIFVYNSEIKDAKNISHKVVFHKAVFKDTENKVKGIIGVAYDITERALNEEKINRQNSLLNAMLDNLPIGIFMVDATDGKPLLANEQAKKLLGRGILPNATKENLTEIYKSYKAGSQRSYPVNEMPIILGMQGIYAHIDDMEIERPDKSRIALEIYGCPVKDEEDKVWASLVGFLDISKRKKVENALRESQTLFQNLAQASPVGIFRTAIDGYTTYVNPKWCEIAGLSFEEALGYGWLKAVHPEDKEEVEFGWKLKIKNAEASTAEYRFLKTDGSIVHVLGNAVPEYANGKIKSYLGTITDITELKKAELTIRQNEEKYRNLVETTCDIIWETNIDGVFTYISPQVESILGYKQEEMLYQSPFKFMPSEFAEKSKEISNKIVEHKETFKDWENTYISKSGEIVIISATGVPVTDENNNIIGYRGIHRDITERKKAEKILIDSENKFKDLINFAPDAFFHGDSKGNFILVNEKAEKLTGYSKEELLSMNMKDLFTDTEMNRKPLRYDLLNQGITLTNEREIIRKDKTILIVEMNSKKMPNGTYQSFMRDITERKTTEKKLNEKNEEYHALNEEYHAINEELEENYKKLFKLNQKLTEQENKYRSITENSTDFIIRFDENGKHIYLNQAALNARNAKEQDLIGKTHFDSGLFGDSQSNYWTEKIKNVLLTGKIFKTIFEWKTKEGVKFLDWKLMPEFNQNGRVMSVLAIARDISDIIITEKALKDSESRTKALIDANPDLMFVISEDYKIIDYKSKDDELYIKPEFFIDKKITEVLPPDVADTTLKHIKLIFETNENQCYNYSLIMNNEKRFYESRLVKLGEDKILALIRDNTEIKKAEEALVLSEQQFRSVWEKSKDGMRLINNDGLIVNVNDAFCKLFEKDKENLLHKSISVIYAEDEAENILKTYTDRKNNNEVIEIVEKEHTLWNGTKKWLQISNTIIPKNNDEYWILSIFRDVTERYLNEELHRNIKIAESTAKIKQQFIANMSHEIRTPLCGIIGMTEILSSTNLDETQTDYLQTIKYSSESLLGIINDILDLSKIEAGKMSLNPNTITLTNFLTKIKTSHEKLIKEKNIDFSIQVLNSIPETFISDEKRLMQIINNLLSNAFKFTNSGFIKINFSLLNIFDKKIKIEVIDSGIGIKQEDKSKLFNKFSQVDSSLSRLYEGSGLGLVICKELAQILNGEVGFESELGKGSNFWFTFIAETNNICNENINNSSDTDATKLNIRILLVEDKIVNQKVISLMLQNIGCTVTTVNNGVEALNIYENNKFDLIFMDIQMPLMDGITATKLLKENYKNLPPIIGLSANAMEGDAEKYISLGLDDYLSKPFTIEQIKEKINIFYKF